MPAKKVSAKTRGARKGLAIAQDPPVITVALILEAQKTIAAHQVVRDRMWAMIVERFLPHVLASMKRNDEEKDAA